MKPFKSSICATLLVLVSMMLMSSCKQEKANVTKAPMRVKTEVVTPARNISGQSYVGIVEEGAATAVSFTSMGTVSRVLVNEGQAVSKGQLLAVMDDTQARNLLLTAEAQMSQAEDALQRYGLLHENGSLPEVQWVEIQSKVAQAKSQLAIAKKNVADCRLVAPVSGIIGRKHVGAGETALPSQSVVTILNIGTVKVKVAIPETEMNSIRSNTSSLIKVEAANTQVQGGYIEKGVQADALTHTYDIRINVANGNRKLLPGMVANVTFGGRNAFMGSVCSLPVTAVQKKSGGSLFVWTINNDSTAHRTAVTIGQTAGNRIAITSGLNDGQRVVTEGYQKLSEGTKVIY